MTPKPVETPKPTKLPVKSQYIELSKNNSPIVPITGRDDSAQPRMHRGARSAVVRAFPMCERHPELDSTGIEYWVQRLLTSGLVPYHFQAVPNLHKIQ
jgi:hypothetical protein